MKEKISSPPCRRRLLLHTYCRWRRRFKKKFCGTCLFTWKLPLVYYILKAVVLKHSEHANDCQLALVVTSTLLWLAKTGVSPFNERQFICLLLLLPLDVSALWDIDTRRTFFSLWPIRPFIGTCLLCSCTVQQPLQGSSSNVSIVSHSGTFVVAPLTEPYCALICLKVVVVHVSVS